MKTFLSFSAAKALFVFLGILCAVAIGHPSYGSDASDMAFDFGNRAFADMSPVPRGLLSSDDVTSGRLSKRACASNQLYCPATNFCCNPGYSCCNVNFCCATGYACPLIGACVPADVVTITFTSTYYITSSALSYIYSTSTDLVVLTSTGYTTITTHVESGISTSTVWATVTTTQVMKRDAVAAPTPAMTETHDLQTVAPRPPIESWRVEGQTPIAELLRRALGDVGLLEKRQDVTSYETLLYTSTYYSYSYSTIGDVVTSTSNAAVQVTLTSTIVDSASSTITVVSTITATVISSKNQVITTTVIPEPGQSTAPPAPASPTSPGSPTTTSSKSSSVAPVPASSTSPPISGTSSTSGGLSKGAKIGIGAGAGAAAVLVFAAIGFCLWKRRGSTADGNASNWDTGMSQPVAMATAPAPAPAWASTTKTASGTAGEMSPTITESVPSPAPTHQAYWSPQQANEMPQQTYQQYESPQQTHYSYEMPQQAHHSYEMPQQAHHSYEMPQQSHHSYELPPGQTVYLGDQINHR